MKLAAQAPGGSGAPLFGRVNPPPSVRTYGRTAAGFKAFMDNVVVAAFGISGLLFFMYLLFGGFKYITAGGDDKAVQEAKKMLTNATIGLAIVTASFFIAEILSTILGFDILNLNF